MAEMYNRIMQTQGLVNLVRHCVCIFRLWYIHRLMRLKVHRLLNASVPRMTKKKWGKEGDKKREKCPLVSFFPLQNDVRAWLGEWSHRDITPLAWFINSSSPGVRFRLKGGGTSSPRSNNLVLLKIHGGEAAAVAWGDELREKISQMDEKIDPPESGVLHDLQAGKQVTETDGLRLHQWVICFLNTTDGSCTHRKCRQVVV